jgi:hypothetical protein
MLPVDESRRPDRKLGFFVFACLLFCISFGGGVFFVHEASLHPPNEFSQGDTSAAFGCATAIALVLAGVAIFQSGWRMLLLIAMAVLLFWVPFAYERAEGEATERERERLDRAMTPRFSPGSLTPLAFQKNLDAIAPLGNGSRNAATWFREFTEPGGARLPEWKAARARAKTVTVPGFTLEALAPDDPLLIEAEPWTEEAACRFYPDAAPVQQSAIPNLAMIGLLGNSWVARGSRNGTVEDLQRTIRLGRLLRQDDVTIGQDEAGVNLVNMAAGAMNGLAVSRGDSQRSTVLGPLLEEGNSITLETGKRKVLIAYGTITKIVEFAKQSSDRRFRLAAIARLNDLREHASGDAGRREATDALLQLPPDQDPMVAATVRWYVSGGK